MSEAGELSEKLRKTVEETDFKSAVFITASIGAAEAYPEDREYDVFQRVDRALYQSKSAGKNKATALE